MSAIKEYATTNWCFTINNPTTEDYDNLFLAIANCNKQTGSISVLVVGRELAATTKTLHLQGYVEFVNELNMYEIKDFPLFQRAHLEFCKGSRHQNVLYCSKGGHVILSGLDK